MAERKTLARPYAEAAFSLATDKDALATWSEMLQVATVVVTDQTIMGMIKNPSVPREQIVEVTSDVCADYIDESGVNFIRLLLENDRMMLMPEISELFEQFKADAENSIEAQVTTAYDLTSEQSDAIAQGLAKKLGRNVVVVSEVDKSLIGGVIIRAGDIIIDGSVTGYLRDLSSQLNH